jgi:signal transduction histidine kinase
MHLIVLSLDSFQIDPNAIKNVTIIKRGNDSNTIFMQKALRSVVNRTLESQDQLYKQFMNAVDSAQFERAFDQALLQKNTHFKTVKIKQPGRDSIFVYAAPAVSTSYIKLDGYKPYLFKQILPQIGFSLFLLLLSGLTFLLAYRNMWRQHRFGKQKDNFISNISHELKTPVATTKVALEALSNYDALEDPKRSKQYLQMANAEMERLEQLVNSVLNTVQTEHGALKLEQESLNPVALLEEITGVLLPVMEEKSVRFSLTAPQENITIKADKMHLRGAFYNLLDNAIKYGGEVLKADISIFENMLQVSIWDNGTGIPEVYHESIFEKFFRIPHGNKHDVKGHGLGLSYARYIIAAHGGTIRLHSVPGQGTTFIVSLPLTSKL